MSEGKNQSDSYRAAFPASKKWKDETVHNKAYQFHKLDEVKARIQQLKDEAKEKSKFDSIQALEQMVLNATYDGTLITNQETGDLLQPHELPDVIKSVVTTIDWNSDGTVRKYNMASKDKALEMLGRYFNMFEGRLDEPPKDNKDFDPVEAARKIIFSLELAKRAKQSTPTTH